MTRMRTGERNIVIIIIIIIIIITWRHEHPADPEDDVGLGTRHLFDVVRQPPEGRIKQKYKKGWNFYSRPDSILFLFTNKKSDEKSILFLYTCIF